VRQLFFSFARRDVWQLRSAVVDATATRRLPAGFTHGAAAAFRAGRAARRLQEDQPPIFDEG
jgi:hypothetical protein